MRFFSAFFIVLLLSACAGEKPLRVEEAEGDAYGFAPGAEGPYRAIYYGEEGAEGDKAVILDPEGDSYEFMPGAEGPYRSESGLSAGEAVERAGSFLKAGGYSMRMKKVLGADDDAIGYELRAYQDMFARPIPNLIEINYRMGRGGKVKVDIKPLPLMDRP